MKDRISRGHKSFGGRKSNSKRANQFDLLWRIQRSLSWLLPGLVLKRWLIISGIGLIVAFFGASIWADLRPIYWLVEGIFFLIGAITKFLPRSITGPLVFLLGISLVIWGQSRSFTSIQKAVAPDKDALLLDALRAKSKLNRGPNIVAIGGGTGLSTLLKGLKKYSSRITAIVTVADDGGSSGILRRELGVQPPGDIRNCLAALSTEESLLTRLFQYRFSSGTGLVGHSFGNLFLSALTSITGNLETAITASSRVLAVQGQVVPATNADVSLWAELENGDRIEGESAIGKVRSPIARIGCYPEYPAALPSAIEAIENAELIVLGPGSLYTSLLPNLLVPQIVEAIQKSKAPKIYICNLMTQPGETDGLDVTGHVRAIEAQLASLGITRRIFNFILAHESVAPSPLLDYYLSRGAEPVQCDLNSLRAQGYKVFTASLQKGISTSATLRHDPARLSRAVMHFYRKYKREN
ncbi:gluconeogenesis factor YvcK family protein [Prochlorococcus marinus]|uniref:gluconeogenesis factor YvcK family protein n=1 Tax=Prochlorococcus marinus TaxID=1219 RepID=UPI003B28565A